MVRIFIPLSPHFALPPSLQAQDRHSYLSQDIPPHRRPPPRRPYNNIPDFDPTAHSLFRIHTHITAQGFIFINFDARETPGVSFTDQFGEDFTSSPKYQASKEVGDEFALFPCTGWTYDHTWSSALAATAYNWKTFVDGFQECYHCATGHPTTLPKDFQLDQYYLRQGTGYRGISSPRRETI